MFNENFWCYIAPILMMLTTTASSFINQKLKIKKGWLKQVISWLVGSVISVLAWAVNIVQFGEPAILGIICLCVIVGLSSNGFYDIPVIRNWLNKFFPKIEDKTNTETTKEPEAE